MKNLFKYIPIIVILIFFIAGSFWGGQQYLNINQLKEHHLFLEQFIMKNQIISLIIYAAIYITITGVSIPGATFLTIAGGFLFGQIIGTIVVVISATLGASVIFLSARLAAGEFLRKKTSKWLKNMQSGFNDNAFSYLLTLRLIPLFPFVAVNLVCALLKVPFKTFFVATFVGIIPGSFVYVSLGVAMREVIKQPDFSPDVIINPKILLALVGLGILALLPVIYKRLHRSS